MYGSSFHKEPGSGRGQSEMPRMSIVGEQFDTPFELNPLPVNVGDSSMGRPEPSGSNETRVLNNCVNDAALLDDDPMINAYPREGLSLTALDEKSSDSSLQKQEFISEIDLILREYENGTKNRKEFPSAKNIMHYICIASEHKPVFRRDYPKSPEVSKALEKQVDAWLDSGIIESSVSLWNFLVVVVPRLNDKFRCCIDFRHLKS